MSELSDLTKSIQSIVGVTTDSIYGLKTARAILAKLKDQASVSDAEVSTPKPPDSLDFVDGRSERTMQGLEQPTLRLARQLVRDAAKENITIRVTSGLRTYAQQDELYEQGRTKPGKIVTNARAGHSNHNFGIAFDVTIFDGNSPVWESPLYRQVGKLGKALGLVWGGDWTSIQDEPHFETRPNWAADLSESAMLAELRKRHDNGTSIWA